MEWLITFRKSVSPEEMARILDDSGCSAELDPPIPLGEDEQVVSVSGPADLPRRLKAEEAVLGVNPNSTLTLY
jgi:hypothetical protein